MKKVTQSGSNELSKKSLSLRSSYETRDKLMRWEPVVETAYWSGFRVSAAGFNDSFLEIESPDGPERWEITGNLEELKSAAETILQSCLKWATRRERTEDGGWECFIHEINDQWQYTVVNPRKITRQGTADTKETAKRECIELLRELQSKPIVTTFKTI